EVANGIISSGVQVELGLLPRGTGGDFRKTLGISARIEEAARTLLQAESRRVDAGEISFVNHQGKTETRFFVNVASSGMSGEVVRRVNSSAKTFGGTITFAYATFAA